MHTNFRNHFLNITQSSACEETEVIQSLWSGYGKISRYQLTDSPFKTAVVKHISLNQPETHPRGWNTNLSHNRKVKSYRVETNWYSEWSQFCTNECPVPHFIGAFSEGQEQWIILEDLNENYPVRKVQVNLSEVNACLQWLAHFHATFLTQKPVGLWETGTYWHLATRPEEFEKIAHPALKAKAHLIDQRLNECRYQTFVHGDAKLANFCFSETGKKVAAVDFQYVGGGCGIKDVAYFLGSCLSGDECAQYEDDLLNFYFAELKKAFDTKKFNFSFEELETEWRMLYPFACADFTRFLLGWMPSHQKVNAYNLDLLNAILDEL